MHVPSVDSYLLIKLEKNRDAKHAIQFKIMCFLHAVN